MFANIGLIAAVCSILGLLYVLQVANSVTGLVCDVENFRVDTSLFLVNITSPLTNISDATAVAVNSIKGKVGNASDVTLYLNDTTSSMVSHFFADYFPIFLYIFDRLLTDF
jgi:hypothetical protein